MQVLKLETNTDLFSCQAKELQTLHNLRKLFVQDLATRVKKVLMPQKQVIKTV